ncbi:MAG TPA: acyl-CoA thioesterase II [Haliangiales bacterium]|nr:acyl-CoA thioesterase II [Haliangiales bacterium]
MSHVVDDLVQLLALERIEENLFRGRSEDLGWGRVFGGQVLGQAVSAAAQTVPPERTVHSLHSYFLRPGAVDRPVIYDVDRIRDGTSFTTRRVVAIQAGRPIFNLSASFQIAEPGLEHQDAMPDVPPPESVPTDRERMAALVARIPPAARERLSVPRPFELRTIDAQDPFAPARRPAVRRVWMRAIAPLPDGESLHRCLLAYVSDFAFVTTALEPHGVSWLGGGMQIASIDHVMWFHRPVRCDEWLLHAMESPAAGGARGLARGQIFSRDGRLVASTAQEGLLRRRAP